MMISKDSRVLIIGQHQTSRTEAIRDYLVPNVREVFVIALGSAFVAKRQSYLFIYENGILKKQIVLRRDFLKNLKSLKLIIPLTFLFYIIDIFRALIMIRKRFDLFIGISHFNGQMGVILKSLGICKKSIYYAIDFYAPSDDFLFFNRFLVRSANSADHLAVSFSDEVWDISPRIKEGRFNFYKLKFSSYSLRHKIVPLGYPSSSFRNKEINEIEQDSLVFIGVIVEEQGLELLVEVFPIVKRLCPNLKVKIIGTGPFLVKLKKIVEDKGLACYFNFYGFVENTDKMLDIVTGSAVGISLWDNRKNKFLNSYFGDPGKTKLYSVCGIPVIVSDSTVYSEVIEKEKAGIAIEYNAEKLVNAIKVILDAQNYSQYKQNMIRAGRKYCAADAIFQDALNFCN